MTNDSGKNRHGSDSFYAVLARPSHDHIPIGLGIEAIKKFPHQNAANRGGTRLRSRLRNNIQRDIII